jgi:uncharacterized protein (TIGR03083 family)
VVDQGAAYAEVMERFAGAVMQPGVDGTAPVGACPGWSVRDVVAHHTGVVVDLTTGNLGEFATFGRLLDQWHDADVARDRDAMTARQVRERQSRTMHELVAEWRTATQELVPMLRGESAFPPSVPPFAASVVVNDVVVHEGDVRAALGLGRAPECAALALTLRAYAFSLEHRIRDQGLPALVLAYAGKELTLGEGAVGGRVAADRYELVRVMAGRRTADEIRALPWEGDPTPYLPVMSEYGPVRQSAPD